MKKTILIMFVLILLSSFAYASEGNYTGFSFDTASTGNSGPISMGWNGTSFIVFDSADANTYGYLKNGTSDTLYWDPSNSLPGEAYGICHNDTHIFVTDAGATQIDIYLRDKTYVRSIGGGGSPWSAIQDCYNNGSALYVTDATADQVWIINTNGSSISDWDLAFDGAEDPHGISCYGGEYCWVVDIADNIVYKFTIDGNLVHKWSVGGQTSNPAGIEVFENYTWVTGITEAEIFRYNSNVTIPPTETATPTFVAPTPATSAHNNTNQTINCSQPGIDRTFYLNVSITDGNQDMPYIVNEAETTTGHKSFFTNFTIDGTYTYECYVRNTTNGIYSTSVSRIFVLDTVTPTITLGNNNNFSTNNLTIISNYLHNLSLNISFFDEHLFQTLINITNESDASVFSILNTTITGTTTNYTNIVDISTLSVGDYTVKLISTDSHTANSIDDYGIFKGLDYLRFITEEGNVIKIKSDTFPLSFRTDKLTDRYTFDFNYLLQEDTYTFIIESQNKISYLPSSDYPAHFVMIGDNSRGNWLDFGGINKKDIVVTKIDDYTYEVEITANGIKSFTFNSLGGLNTVEEHYKFRIGAVIDIWVFDEENHPVQINATATIGVQSSNSTINTSGATLINITKETTTLTLTSPGFGTEEKTISITESYHNLSFNMSVTNAVKVSFYDEKSEALIEGESFSVYLATTGFSNTYSSITDNPNTISGLTAGNYELKVSSSNYQEREYSNLAISDTDTTFLDVYLINNTLGSEVTFNIVSADGLGGLANVRTVFTKIINGTSTIVAEKDSDFAGQVVLDLDSNTEYTINFSLTNYEDQTITLEPKNSDYLIRMVSTVGAYNQSVHEGIRYSFSPSNTILNNNTMYNFSFTLNSTVWPITNCTLKLYNGSIFLSQTSSFTSTSCYNRIELNTSSMTTIVSEGIYELDSTYEFTVTQQYSVIYTYEGEFSLKSFLDDLTSFSMAGFDSFGRMMLAFIVIFIILAMAGMNLGIDNKELLLFIFWALVGFFSYVGWFTLELSTMPDLLGLKKWFVFYLISLVCGGFVINKMRQ